MGAKHGVTKKTASGASQIPESTGALLVSVHVEKSDSALSGGGCPQLLDLHHVVATIDGDVHRGGCLVSEAGAGPEGAGVVVLDLSAGAGR